MIQSMHDFFYRMHACGITEDNAILCWGDNTHGETDVQDGTYSDAAVWAHGTWGIADDGRVSAWGNAALPPDGIYSDIAAGNTGIAAIDSNGDLTVWDEQAGTVLAEATGPYTAVAAGDNVCTLRVDGGLDCHMSKDDSWWDEFYADLPTTGVVSFCLLADDVGCYLDDAGAPAMFGGDWFVDRADIPMPTDRTFTQIACGNQHVCGLTPEGEIVCWGEDYYGETTTPN